MVLALAGDLTGRVTRFLTKIPQRQLIGVSNTRTPSRHARHLHGPQPEAMLSEMFVNPGHHLVALVAIEQLGKMLHHARIGIERRERRPISVAPSPQQ